VVGASFPFFLAGTSTAADIADFRRGTSIVAVVSTEFMG